MESSLMCAIHNHDRAADHTYDILDSTPLDLNLTEAKRRTEKIAGIAARNGIRINTHLFHTNKWVGRGKTNASRIEGHITIGYASLVEPGSDLEPFNPATIQGLPLIAICRYEGTTEEVQHVGRKLFPEKSQLAWSNPIKLVFSLVTRRLAEICRPQDSPAATAALFLAETIAALDKVRELPFTALLLTNGFLLAYRNARSHGLYASEHKSPDGTETTVIGSNTWLLSQLGATKYKEIQLGEPYIYKLVPVTMQSTPQPAETEQLVPVLA